MKRILFTTYFLAIALSAYLVAMLVNSGKPKPTSTTNNPSPAIAQTSPAQPLATVKIQPLSPQTPSPAPVPSQATVSVQPQQPSPPKPNPSPSPQPTASVQPQQPSPAKPNPSPSPAKPNPSPSPQPTASASPSIPCELSAYVIDQDPNGVNVRSEPGSNEKIIGNLPTQTEGVMVDITACQGKWVQITNAISDGGNKVEFQGKGWVYASSLGAATTEHETNGTPLYAQSDKNSKILSKLPPNRTVKLLGGSGPWMEVEYEGMRGWLGQYDYCPNPWTSCS